MITKPVSIEVTFTLPDWFPPDRFEHHDLIGGDRKIYRNSALEKLQQLPCTQEVYVAQTCGNSVVAMFKFDLLHLPERIAKFQKELENLLAQYKEAGGKE